MKKKESAKLSGAVAKVKKLYVSKWLPAFDALGKSVALTKELTMQFRKLIKARTRTKVKAFYNAHLADSAKRYYQNLKRFPNAFEKYNRNTKWQRNVNNARAVFVSRVCTPTTTSKAPKYATLAKAGEAHAQFADIHGALLAVLQESGIESRTVQQSLLAGTVKALQA